MNKLQVLIGITIILILMSNTEETPQPKQVKRVSKEHEEFVNNLLNKKISQINKTTEIVDVTMYNAVVDQCDSDPLITACMYRINPNRASEHKWIAMSRNLLKRWGGNFDFGQKVKLVGCGKKDGIYIVADVMNKRYVNRVDILETQGVKLYKYKNVKLIAI